MRQVAVLSGRELRSYFWSPVGYICAALLLLLISLAFRGSFDQGRPATMQSVFAWGMWVFLFVCPAISMGAISEERRAGTFELLMTSPIAHWQIILSKFLGTLAFLAVLLIPTLAHVGLLELYGRPDYGEVACGYLGLILAGAAYLATGLLASTLTTSQLVAFLGTMVFWLALMMGGAFLPQVLSEPWASLAFAIDPRPRLQDFAIGLIDTANVVYFVSMTAVCLIGATLALEARRWP